jgi:hypothetical protein
MWKMATINVGKGYKTLRIAFSRRWIHSPSAPKLRIAIEEFSMLGRDVAPSRTGHGGLDIAIVYEIKRLEAARHRARLGQE